MTNTTPDPIHDLLRAEASTMDTSVVVGTMAGSRKADV